MRTRNYFLLGAALAALIGGPVLADVTYTQGSGTTIFDFTCFTTKHCSAHVPITSAGTEILPATSTNQTSELTKLDTIITNTGAAIPAGTAYMGQSSADPSKGGATPAFAFLALPATTTTQIVALSGSTVTYVTSLMAFGGGTTNVTFKTGTGSNCVTGTATLAGPYPLTAQAGFSLGSGTGAVMIVPSGKALCITTDASVSGGVQLTYQQF